MTSVEEQLTAAGNMIEVLSESLADAELALEDAGWARIGAESGLRFSRAGLETAARLCTTMSIVNPLIKRGLALRSAYVHGLGVAVTARDESVNEVIQAMLDDPLNSAALFSDKARQRLERGTLGTTGNLFVACPTNPLTGYVQVRTIPMVEITDVISNPDDSVDVWLYRRQWTSAVFDQATGGTVDQPREEWYPALGYRPAQRAKSIAGRPVNWDTPITHMAVNTVDGWTFGIGDAYAAIPWARSYKDFLSDWATLMRSLAKIAWHHTPKSKAQQARSTIQAAIDAGLPAGSTAVTDGKIEAVNKSGASFDAESGKPLAAMVAAGMEVPLTMLLADPGQTGARAVAETLDKPTEDMASARRGEWSDLLRRIFTYAIQEAVRAPAGPLRGRIVRDKFTGREVITLNGEAPATVDITWPDLTTTPVDTIVKAIRDADDTGKLPPLVVARLLLVALGVEDVDEILDQLTDADGNWIDPLAGAGDPYAQSPDTDDGITPEDEEDSTGGDQA